MNDEEIKLRMAAAGYKPKKRTRQVPKTLSDIKLAAIREALNSFGGNRERAAERLGITERGLYKLLAHMRSMNKVQKVQA